MARQVRTAVRVEGVVQGVGFRPFVYALANRLGLAGLVGNDVHGVFVEVEGPSGRVDDFLTALRTDAPPLASVEHVATREIPPTGAPGFTIVASPAGGERATLVSADSSTCADCLTELADRRDRRFGYPFINCTNCGPRFTIVRDVPYDRPFTTMAEFAMCAECAAEYHDPADRRFHAQPTCCPVCGPQVSLLGHDVADPIGTTAELLCGGAVVAVKGLGGYHLATDGTQQGATAVLRARKHREDKPFAVMVSTVEQARALCDVDGLAELLLSGRRRPIVLLPRVAGARIAAAVAPGNRRLGVMLPYTPLHHLLLAAVGRPLVLTSGNVSDEPIAYRDADAIERLAGIADAFLVHDRAIHIRTDDSVVRPFDGRETVLRRSRGYVPEPVSVKTSFSRPTLACGAELKNTFCLGKGNRAFLSHHIGDLENFETLRSFTEGIKHFRRLFDIDPVVVAHDLHPEYLSTKYALELDGVELVGVQHHHAHIASCLADNGESGPVIGVAFDGTGFGTDGTIWGGEFLLADLAGFSRVGHLDPVPMPGGVAAIRGPWRMAAAHLAAAYPDGVPDLGVVRRNAADWDTVSAMAARGVNSPRTSSAGRLFDAVAALLGIRDAINYEGQAAIELEQCADPDERGSYPVTAGNVLPCEELIRAVVEDVRRGVAVPVVAARFHNAVADAVTGICERVRDEGGVGTVALSGGVWQNLLLTTRAMDSLRARGFRVLTHSRVPCNDGGISLGQAAVVAALDRIG